MNSTWCTVLHSQRKDPTLILMTEGVRKEPCKQVTTYAAGDGTPNGHLIELFKDGDKTTVYLSTVLPKAFKGYHLHRVRESHYVCLKGRVKITVADGQKTSEYVLGADTLERLLLPTHVFIGIENVGDEEVWLINFPHPSYDPSLKGEQVDKTPEEIAAQLKGG